MLHETGDHRVWVDRHGVHLDLAGARLDMEWGCGLAAFATRDDVRDAIRTLHGAAVLAAVDAAVAEELAAQVPGSPAEAARRARDQLIGAPIFADWLGADRRVFIDQLRRAAPVVTEVVPMDGGSDGAVERLRAVATRAAGQPDHDGAPGDEAELVYEWERASWNPHTVARESARVWLRDGDRRLTLAVEGGSATWSATGFSADDDARIADMIDMLLPAAVRTAGS
jgi:hypothetical protein